MMIKNDFMIYDNKTYVCIYTYVYMHMYTHIYIYQEVIHYHHEVLYITYTVCTVLCYSDRVSFCMWPRLTWNPLCSSCWPQTSIHIGSASQVLALYIVQPLLCYSFKSFHYCRFVHNSMATDMWVMHGAEILQWQHEFSCPLYFAGLPLYMWSVIDWNFPLLYMTIYIEEESLMNSLRELNSNNWTNDTLYIIQSNYPLT